MVWRMSGNISIEHCTAYLTLVGLFGTYQGKPIGRRVVAHITIDVAKPVWTASDPRLCACLFEGANLTSSHG
jgi:hypothetical protein